MALSLLAATRWIALSCLGFAACAPSRGDALSRIREQGFVRAGVTPEAPYAVVDSAGRVGGESPEALRRALASVGVDSVQWVLLDFDQLIPALNVGRVDVVAAGLFDTPARRERVRFSRTTFCARPALVRRMGTEPFSGLRDFVGPEGGALAVLAGAVEHEAARALGVPPHRLLPVPDLATGVAAVRGGGAEALALSTPSLRNVVKADTGLTWDVYEPAPAVASLVAGCSALAFRLADDALAQAVDRGLAVYVGTAAHHEVLASLGLTLEEAAVALPKEAGGS